MPTQDQDSRDMLNKVAVGIEAERFIESSIGKYLIAKAEQERDEAMASLRSISPIASAEIRELQNRIWRAESVQRWLAELIQEGWNAESELIDRETT